MDPKYAKLGLVLAACLLAYLAISILLAGMASGSGKPPAPAPGVGTKAGAVSTPGKPGEDGLALGGLKVQKVVQGKALRVVLNSTDLEGRALTYEPGTLPPGSVFFPGNRTFRWTPDLSRYGDFAVNFTVKNGSLSGSQVLTIRVERLDPLPDPVNLTLRQFLELAARPGPSPRSCDDGAGGARSRTVRPGESIQAAVTAAAPGDTVVVEKGVYAERVTVNKAIVLCGLGNPVIDGEGMGSPLSLAMDGVTVEGFSLRNSGSSPQAGGIKIYSNRNIVANNTITGNQYGIFVVSPGNGNIIQGNWILNSTSSGIRVSNCMDTSLRSNTVVNNQAGIEIDASWYLAITGNLVSFNNGDGLRLTLSQQNGIEENTVMNNRGAGILLSKGGKNRIRGNYVGKNTGNGIETRDFADYTLKGNQVLASLENLALNFIGENTVKGQKGHGIVGNRTNNLIEENEVGNNNYGMYFVLSHSLARNNVMTGNSYGVVLLGSGNSSFTGNTIQGNTNGVKVDGKSGNNEFFSNLVADNRQDGFTLGKSTEHNVLSENTIANHTRAGLVDLGKNLILTNFIVNNTRV